MRDLGSRRERPRRSGPILYSSKSFLPGDTPAPRHRSHPEWSWHSSESASRYNACRVYLIVNLNRGTTPFRCWLSAARAPAVRPRATSGSVGRHRGAPEISSPSASESALSTAAQPAPTGGSPTPRADRRFGIGDVERRRDAARGVEDVSGRFWWKRRPARRRNAGRRPISGRCAWPMPSICRRGSGRRGCAG